MEKRKELRNMKRFARGPKNGMASLLELVLRGSLMYLALFLLLRVVLKVSEEERKEKRDSERAEESGPDDE